MVQRQSILQFLYRCLYEFLFVFFLFILQIFTLGLVQKMLTVFGFIYNFLVFYSSASQLPVYEFSPVLKDSKKLAFVVATIFLYSSGDCNKPKFKRERIFISLHLIFVWVWKIFVIFQNLNNLCSIYSLVNELN